MIDTPAKSNQVYLRPGELLVCQEALLVSTILGSCVAVTLFNARHRLAAICHALLAEPLFHPGADEKTLDPFRYVSLAIPAMTAEFFRRGIPPGEIEVKLFGGATVLAASQSGASERGVGQANLTRAMALLEAENLRISRAHVGGDTGRKLIFDTATGIVMLKQLTSCSARVPSNLCLTRRLKY